MKHIKTYTIFENLNKKSEEEIYNYLKDIFLEVEDMGINVEIDKDLSTYKEVFSEPGKVGGTREVTELNKITVKIGVRPTRVYKKLEKNFLLKDVYDTVLTSKSYMLNEGFFLSNIEGDCRDAYKQISHYGLLFGCNLYDKGIRELFNKPLNYLELEFRIDKKWMKK